MLYDDDGNYLTTVCVFFVPLTLDEAKADCQARGMQLFDASDENKVNALNDLEATPEPFSPSFWVESTPPKCDMVQKLNEYHVYECNCDIVGLYICEACPIT